MTLTSANPAKTGVFQQSFPQVCKTLGEEPNRRVDSGRPRAIRISGGETLPRKGGSQLDKDRVDTLVG